MRISCEDCNGACCKQYRVSMHWSEAQQLKIPINMIIPIRIHEVAMKGTEGPVTKCVALSDNGRCTIHGNHPQVCRDVEPGSEQCLKAKKTYTKN